MRALNSYIELVKTAFQNLATATAISLHRVFDWSEEVPRSLTCVSPFVQLAPEQLLISIGGDDDFAIGIKTSHTTLKD